MFKVNFFNKSEQSILLNTEKIIVGFSGGVDSTLVLAATNQFLEAHNKKNCLTALHVNHQTQSNSSGWEIPVSYTHLTLPTICSV